MTYPQRRALFEQLNAMSDRQLADIGLNRSDLSRVFDADFAEAREAAARARPRAAKPLAAANSNVAIARAA